MAVRPTLAIILFASICGLVLCGIAYGTDWWRIYTVKYGGSSDNSRVASTYNRSTGFFRECFAKTDEDLKGEDTNWENTNQIGGSEVYKSPLNYPCHAPEIGFNPDYGTDEENHLAILRRAYVACYAVGLLLGILGVLNLFVGCAYVRALPVGSSAVMLMLSACFLAIAGGIWHKADEKYWAMNEQRFNEPPDDLTTEQTYGWSMVIHWVGTLMILLAGILSLIGCLSADRHHQKKRLTRNLQVQGAQPVIEVQTAGAVGSDPKSYSNQGYVSDANAKAAQALAPYGYGYPAAGYATYGYGGYGYDPYGYGMQSYGQY